MGKKQSGSATAKAAKKAKAVQKVERKETKKGKAKRKGNESDTDDDDLEGILERMRKEWEEAHTVTEELVEGPPSRRANATLTACPNGNHIWCIGGEFFSDDGRAYFYNDVFRYTPEKDEWRKFVSPTCPGPRSAHAVVASPIGGGKLFLFGGEFSSLHQNTFHHYRDFWCFDIATHSWDRIDTKIRPSARSGHRMAIWKHYIVLFGGFYDPGITTRYLNDLWLFDTQEYVWQQAEFKETDNKPSPRSGFSFLPCADGIVLHGGYCKEYAKGKRPVGVMLEDTWLLKLTLPTAPSEVTTSSGKAAVQPAKSAAKAKSSGASKSQNQLAIKWERRKRPSDAYAPTLRSGCTMTLWAAKGMGILFGGVTDEDTNEETLESVFWNDLYGYQLTGKGKWNSLSLKKQKPKNVKRGAKKKSKDSKDTKWKGQDSNDEDKEDEDQPGTAEPAKSTAHQEQSNPEDPFLTTPLSRYNAMLAVLRNTLYGGIYERGSREYTLDDFYSLQLDKLDKYVCLKASDVIIPEGDVESSSDEDDDDDEDDEDEDDEVDGTYYDEIDEEETLLGDVEDTDLAAHKIEDEIKPIDKAEEEDQLPAAEPQDDIRSQATAFMGVAKDTTRSAEDVQSTPLPGETLAMFYARSRDYWTQKGLGDGNDRRGKELRRNGFELAKERYASYKPILEEIEKILAEAGLDEEEMRRGAAGGPPSGGASGMSRNRR